MSQINDVSWHYEGTPKIGVEVIIETNKGIRRAKMTLGYHWHFTDCTHPLQNIFCPFDAILRWRYPLITN